MTKPKGGALFTVLFLLFCIAIPILLAITLTSAKNYTENGKLYKCTVTRTELTSEIIEREKIFVSYKDKKGNSKEAELYTFNSVEEGDIFSVYVLSDSPDTAFYPLPKTERKTAVCICALLFAASLFLTVCHTAASRRYRLLLKKGKPARGEVISVKKSGSIYKTVMTFKDIDRQDVTMSFKFKKSLPYVGEHYTVTYFKKRSGRYIAEVYEMR